MFWLLSSKYFLVVFFQNLASLSKVWSPTMLSFRQVIVTLPTQKNFGLKIIIFITPSLKHQTKAPRTLQVSPGELTYLFNMEQSPQNTRIDVVQGNTFDAAIVSPQGKKKEKRKERKKRKRKSLLKSVLWISLTLTQECFKQDSHLGVVVES